MKTKSSKTIIYDSHCPMCNWYTGEFIKLGVLDKKNGRKSFDEIQAQDICKIDPKRAKHEIPLIDNETGETLYGLDSLGYLLGQKMAIVPQALSIKPIYLIMKAFYSLISYNRRIISGSNETGNGLDCQPDFSLKYRGIYLAFALLVGSLSSIFVGEAFNTFDVGVNGNIFFPAMAGSWLIIVAFSRITLPFKKWMDYIGHLATLLLIGTLLFTPWYLFNQIIPTPHGITLIFGMLIGSFFMVKEHFRRVKNYGLPNYLNWVWLGAWSLGIWWMLY